MTVFRKIKTGLKLASRGNFSELIEAIKANILSHRNPDETLAIFEVLSKLQSDGIMIDVGAHYGHPIFPFLEHGWVVYAFEPDPENRSVLSERYKDFSSLYIDPRAVSDKEEKGVSFFKSAVSSGISSLSPFHQSHQPVDKVDITTLKIFMAERDLLDQQIDFLKIDTEGHDLFVLKGYPWDMDPPRVIICEYEDSKTKPLGYTFQDTVQFLTEKGYKTIISEWHPIKEYGGSHTWKCYSLYPFTDVDPKSWGNIIAVRDDLIFEKLLKQCINS